MLAAKNAIGCEFYHNLPSVAGDKTTEKTASHPVSSRKEERKTTGKGDELVILTLVQRVVRAVVPWCSGTAVQRVLF